MIKGDAEIGFSQMSEILASSDVDAVGPLPVDIQNFTTFTFNCGLRSYCHGVATCSGTIINLRGLRPTNWC